MNCKPGDLAIFLPPPYVSGYEFSGRVLRVIKPSAFHGTWFVEPLFPNGDDSTWDKYLRPIRDPGDDAVDETIVRLGKPVPDEVTA